MLFLIIFQRLSSFTQSLSKLKSGREGKPTGMIEFKALFPGARTILIGSGGVPLEEFFEMDAKDLFYPLYRHTLAF